MVVKMEFGEDRLSLWQDDPNNPIEIDLTESVIDLEPTPLSGSKTPVSEPTTHEAAVDSTSVVATGNTKQTRPFPTGCHVVAGESSVRPVLSEKILKEADSKVEPIVVDSSPLRPNQVFGKSNISEGVASSQSSPRSSPYSTPSRPLVMLDKLPAHFDTSAFNIGRSPSKETIQKTVARLGQVCGHSVRL